MPAALYAIWRDTLGEGIAAATLARGVRDVRAGDRTEAAPIRAVSPNFFSTLGVTLAIGEAPSAALRDRSSAFPAVLSYRMWQRLFDGDPNVLGRGIWILRPTLHDCRCPAATLLVLGHEQPDLDGARSGARSAPKNRWKSSCAGRPAQRPPCSTRSSREAWPIRVSASGRRTRRPAPRIRHRRHADRPPGGADPALPPWDLRAADAADRVRQRRDPADRAMDDP